MELLEAAAALIMVSMLRFGSAAPECTNLMVSPTGPGFVAMYGSAFSTTAAVKPNSFSYLSAIPWDTVVTEAALEAWLASIHR